MLEYFSIKHSHGTLLMKFDQNQVFCIPVNNFTILTKIESTCQTNHPEENLSNDQPQQC
jgi:hypothetical protein